MHTFNTIYIARKGIFFIFVPKIKLNNLKKN